MKRRLLYGGSALLSGLIAASLWFQLGSAPEAVEGLHPLEEKTSWTPQELLQKEIEAKRKRREEGYAKADKPNEYTKFHEAIRTKWGADAPDYEPSYKFKELQKAKLRNKGSHVARTRQLEWIERGPANVPGRTRGLLVMPNDPEKNTWLAGSVAGGIWKTTDGGQNWVSLTPELSNMATTSLVSSVANPQIIYAGTGESFAGYNGVNGDGVFKSVDGGNTWTQLSSTADNNNFRNVNRLLIDQANPNIIFAATSPSYWGNGDADSKIMKSVDGGVSWRNVYQASADIEQVIAHPDNINTIYASVNSIGVIKSTDGGENWANTGSLPNGGRIELAIAPTNPDRLYAQAVGSISGTGTDLFTSSNGGENWELVASLNNGAEYDFLGGQGWYDNTVAVNPFDENEAYLAGVNMFKVNLGDAGLTEADVMGVEQDYTASFLDFVNFNQAYFGGRLSKGTLPAEEYGTVEVRFGAGRSQMAHRFTVPANGGTNSDGGAGVPNGDYNYQDYVEVPFEVWDVTHNRQLMVSFRDQERDGMFNLKDRQYSDDQLLDNREYLYIHALPYEANPNAEVAVAGGQTHKQMYFFWPTLTPDAVWDPAVLPEAKLVIEYGQREARDREVTVVADAYGNFGGPNRFSQQTNQTEVTGLHPDHHNITMVPIDDAAGTFKVLVGNDGGVFVSNISTTPGVNDGDWTFAGNGYNTTQFYGVDKMPGKDVYIGGTQDNGTWRSPADASAGADTRYYRALGGDGFEVVWNYDKPEMMMGTIYYNAVYRTTNGGQTWSSATNGLTDNSAENAPFITKLANHKSRPNVVYAVGQSGVWRTEDFGGRWSLASINEKWKINSFSDVTVSEANPYIVWAGSGMAGSLNLHVSTDGGRSFSTTTNYDTETLGVITGIFTHPTEDSTAYALFSFAKSPKILRTRDLGQSWEDISGFEGSDVSANGFPDVAVYSLLVLPHKPEVIWAGTEIGIVESTDNGRNWALAENGFPKMSVWDMKVVDDQVVVGTHARGIWTVSIPELPAIVQSPVIAGAGDTPTQSVAMQLNLRSAYDSVHVKVDGEVKKTMVATAQMDTLIFLKDEFVTDKQQTIEVVGYKRNIMYPSEGVRLKSAGVPEPVKSFASIFAKEEKAFNGVDYTITRPPEFRDHALHTKHPYDHNKEYISQLRYPVIVAEAAAKIKYDDIALVEGAAEGAVFGEEAFNDYVVVEGSKDGLNWLPLVDGYNSSSNEKWKTTYEFLGAKIDANLFKSQQIDLHDTFVAGDTIFVRFRMHTNGTRNGYGWVIDNLQIQDNSPLGFNEGVFSGQFSLEVFPNPASTHSNFHFYIPQAANVSLNVYDVNGMVVDKVQLGNKAAGEHYFTYNLPNQIKQGQLLVTVLTTDKGDIKSVRILKK